MTTPDHPQPERDPELPLDGPPDEPFEEEDDPDNPSDKDPKDGDE